MSVSVHYSRGIGVVHLILLLLQLFREVQKLKWPKLIVHFHFTYKQVLLSRPKNGSNKTFLFPQRQVSFNPMKLKKYGNIKKSKTKAEN